MTFLLHAARKLSLKREINTKNYQLTQISAQYQEKQKEIANFQENIAKQKNAVAALTSTMTTSINTAAMIQALQQKGNMSQEDAQDAFARIQSGDMTVAQQYQDAISMGNYAAHQAAQQMASTINNVSDSIFTAVNESKLKVLNSQSTLMEQKKMSIETELKLLEGDYQATCDAEKSAVKECAPQFGLA